MESQTIRYWVPALFAALALIAYAALIPSGRWQGDEYFLASLIHAQKWNVVVSHLRWAPRPIAEPMTWLYLTVSNALHRPLAAAFLAVMWSGCLVWIGFIGWLGRERHPIILAVLLFALTLMLSKPGEMFYWPDGAAAYLPCWAGLAGVSVLQRSARPNSVAMMACLLLAVLSLEVGAITVLIFAALSCAAGLRDRQLRRLWPLVLPSLCAVMVCLTVLIGRIRPMSEVIDPSSGLAGNWPASLMAALPSFADQAFRVAGLPLLAGGAVKLLILVVLPPHDSAGEERHVGTGALWACALLLAAFFSQAIAFHAFGTQCCQRHETQRQAMILLALVSLTGSLPPAASVWRKFRPAAMTAIVIGLLLLRAAPVEADWKNQPRVLAARQRNWDSARAQGDTMTLLLAPAGEITNSDGFPPGRFHLCGNAANCVVPWYALGLMNLFDKHDLSIVLAK